jgi:hypothetical protein
MTTTIPGFSAERSLYQGLNTYWKWSTRADSAVVDARTVVPQAGPCCEWLCEGLPWTGLHNCECIFECPL